MPEPLPETGVLANHSSGKFERNERKNERMNYTHSGFLILDEASGAKGGYVPTHCMSIINIFSHPHPNLIVLIL